MIGLDVYGYGRILGQCHTTAKLFYCMWMTVARDQDPFTCQALQQIPNKYTMEEAKTLINTRIMGKPMHLVMLVSGKNSGGRPRVRNPDYSRV